MPSLQHNTRAAAWLALLVITTGLLSGCAWQRESTKSGANPRHALLPDWFSSSKPASGSLTSGAAAAAAPVDNQLPPADAATLCLTTARQFDQGDRPAEAVAQYERVLSLQPDTPGISARLAVLHGRLGNHELASRHFQKALEQSPRDGRLWNDYGYHHYQNGRWSEAERAFRESCRLDSKLERNHINLGLALAQQNRLNEAFEAFTKAVSPGAAHSNIGMVLAQQGRAAEALEAFEQALRTEPNLRQTQVARDVVARAANSHGAVTREAVAGPSIAPPTVASDSMAGGTIVARHPSGGAVSGGAVSGGAVSGGAMAGGAMAGGAVPGGAMAGGTMAGMAGAGPGRASGAIAPVSHFEPVAPTQPSSPSDSFRPMGW